ncbi:torsin-like protein [Symsagittifera roscoffensis]|uniref:torsin-like protein n=1 Tax=Symsagittifera roscoffensis TaxID=84072 RepID=UPI00307B9D4F
MPFPVVGFLVTLLIEKPYCYINECCRDPWVSSNSTQLRLNLERHMCGQVPAKNMIISALKHHWQDSQPKKPLVMSFHGSPGVGKTHALKIIRDTMFKEGEKTWFFDYINAPLDFPYQDDEKDLRDYREKLLGRIKRAVEKCDRALIILDETHLMNVKLLESARPFFDSNEQVNGVDCRKATFILVTNTGFDGLVDMAYQYDQKGLSAHDIPTLEVETVLKAIAFADKQGSFYKSLILAHHLIDFFVPFFPLDKNHVKCCIRNEVERRFGFCPKESIVESILNTIKFVPDYDPKFADVGCKSVPRAIAMHDFSHSATFRADL